LAWCVAPNSLSALGSLQPVGTTLLCTQAWALRLLQPPRTPVVSAQDILTGQAKLVGNQRVRYGLPGRVDVGGEVTAKDIIIATGSVPFVPPGGSARDHSPPGHTQAKPQAGCGELQQQRREKHVPFRCSGVGCIRAGQPGPLASAGIPIDGKTVFTSDHALKLEWLPNWIAIIGSGYIGLEFSDV
jgi:hypothetical protein